MPTNPDPHGPREVVTKGAALLDTLVPGWYKVVKPERLKMGEGALCMMGQLFGREVEGKLARSMYLKVFENLPPYVRTAADGYGVAMCHAGLNDNGILDDILALHDLKADMKEALALREACAGYDNKCYWAEEVADRLARDEVATETTTPNGNPQTPAA